jgi:chitin synthase
VILLHKQSMASRHNSVNNLLSLSLHDSITKTLKTNYNNKQYDTFISPHILVRLNPFQKQDIYSSQTKHLYHFFPRNTEPPAHIYALGETVSRSMLEAVTKHNQTVIFKGTCGSGKSESCQQLLGYLVSTSKNNVAAEDSISKLMESSRVLEAFGSAKTFDNTNATRYVSNSMIRLTFTGKTYRDTIQLSRTNCWSHKYSRFT